VIAYFGVLIGVLSVYTISMGPMYWLAGRGMFIGDGPVYWLADFYAPLWWLEKTPLKEVLYWYVDLGMP
jgi:hypothetical protein